MASNITSFVAIPDGTPSTPSVINSQLSQLQLNVISANSLALDIQSGSESIATGAVGSVQIEDGSVTGVKLATSGITSRAYKNFSVQSLHLASGGATASMADHEITGVKLATSAVTERILASVSVTSAKLGLLSVHGPHLQINTSRVTTGLTVANSSPFATQAGNLGTQGFLTSETLSWSNSWGASSGKTTGFALGGVFTLGGTPAYGSLTSIPSIRVFSDNTEYAQFHSAGFVISNTSPPSGGKGSGHTGDVRWASGFLYVCSSTSSWERVALSRF